MPAPRVVPAQVETAVLDNSKTRHRLARPVEGWASGVSLRLVEGEEPDLDGAAIKMAPPRRAPPEPAPALSPETAEAHKARGNDAWTRGDVAGAEAAWSEALAAGHPERHKILSNRAAARRRPERNRAPVGPDLLRP